MLKDLISLLMNFINPASSTQKSHQIISKKNNTKQFDSTISGLLKTLNEFAVCLNSKTIEKMPLYNLNKVCFILINSYENENENFGIGPLNDGIHICLHYHRLRYKVFYLYNPQSTQFINYLEYFLKNTIKNLTVFYSGNDIPKSNIHEIKFPNGQLPSNIVKKSISQYCHGKAKVIFITNSFNGGSVFDINSIKISNAQQTSDIVSFWVKKDQSNHKSHEVKKSHGIFIYYLCKIINDSTNISPKEIAGKINPSIESFNEYLKFDVTNTDLIEAPLIL